MTTRAEVIGYLVGIRAAREHGLGEAFAMEVSDLAVRRGFEATDAEIAEAERQYAAMTLDQQIAAGRRYVAEGPAQRPDLQVVRDDDDRS